VSSKFKVLFLYPNEPFLNPAPIAIGILAAILKQRDIEVDVFDSTFYETEAINSDLAKLEHLQVKPFNFRERGIFPDKGDMFEDLRAKVKDFKPNLIALSVLEGTYRMGLKMLEAIKDYKIPVVVGGVLPTIAPDEVIANPAVNFVCVGEGESALLELCQSLIEGKDYTKIKNLWVKKNHNVIIRNPLCDVVDLDSLPIPDYGVFDSRRLYRPMAGRIYRMVPMETNRGCIFHCAFCNSPTIAKLYRNNKINNFFRKKSIKKIYQELRFLIEKWNAEYVYFASDTFLVMSEKEFDEFIEMYSEFKLPFWIQTRPETVRSDMMKRLKNVGCHRISIGLEHGNPEFRKKILRKNFDNEIFIKATKIINKAGIPLTVNNIIGFPFETRKLIFDTIELNRKISLDSCNAYAFYPFKGTELYAVCKRKGLIREDIPLPTCVTLGSILGMPQLLNEEIRGLMRTFVLYVRMPKEHWKEIKKAEKFDKVGNMKFKELRDMCKKKYS
jgi:radical SAM superfamily enzyme YgiQ (UPF0313 family)